MTNEKLQGILFPGKFQQRPQYLEPDYAYVHKELAKPGVTLAMLWDEYCTKAKSVGAKPYMTTQFREKYHIWARIQNATMRLKHKPGDVMEVDWADQTIPIYDPDTGNEDKAYLFIAVLPFSGYAYVEACADMKSECWICCHMHAYAYFGGVTRLLVPDNLKTGVIKNTRYDTVLNKSYLEMAEHYGTAIVPTRVRHPKDKPYAEGTVKLTYQKILAPLRNRKFFSVKEANDAVAVQLEVLNTTPFQKREGNRQSAFLQDEKEFLLPLPTMQYEPAIWIKAKVPTDYLVSDGKNKYSVPFDLIGEEVDIRLTKSNVEIFFKGSRVASHIRAAKVQRDPIIFEEHMTPEHRKYLRYNADDFRVWVKGVGQKTEKVIELLLLSKREPEQSYKECATLSHMCDWRYEEMIMEGMLSQLREMHLDGMVAELTSQMDNPAEVAHLSFEERFGMLVGAEWSRKRTNRIKRYITQAKFAIPSATIDGIQYHPDRHLDRAQMMEFALCKFIQAGHHIIFKGAAGNGNYLARAIRNAACRRDMSVRYIRLPEILEELAVARDNGEFHKIVMAYKRVRLLILDEWLIRSLTPAEAYDLLEIIEARYSGGSTIFYTQYSTEEWYDRISPAAQEGSPISEAIMDRIVHNAYIVEIQGKMSMRKRHELYSSETGSDDE